MKTLIIALALSAGAVATPAFAQSYSADYGTGNVRPVPMAEGYSSAYAQSYDYAPHYDYAPRHYNDARARAARDAAWDYPSTSMPGWGIIAGFGGGAD